MTRKKTLFFVDPALHGFHNPYPPKIHHGNRASSHSNNIFPFNRQLPSTHKKKQCQSRMPIPYAKQRKSTCIWINQTIIPAVTKSCESLSSHKTIHISHINDHYKLKKYEVTALAYKASVPLVSYRIYESYGKCMKTSPMFPLLNQ